MPSEALPHTPGGDVDGYQQTLAYSEIAAAGGTTTGERGCVSPHDGRETERDLGTIRNTESQVVHSGTAVHRKKGNPRPRAR